VAALRVFAAAKLPEEMLPMPGAVPPLAAFGDDAGQMECDSMRLVHDKYHFHLFY
jgi:hypothetical protein